MRLNSESSRASILRIAVRIATALVIVLSCGALVALGYHQSWTGFGSQVVGDETVPQKTLWDWLELLIVPIVLALGAFLLDGSRRRSDRQIESDHQRQQVLDGFFSYISDLLLTSGLREKDCPSYVRNVARTRTLSALRQLDGRRKVELLQFLYEAGLISHEPIIQLNGCDLRDAQLDEASLQGAELRGVYFHRASIRQANLRGADMRGSDFTGADLTGSDLTGARLAQANVGEATLTRTIIKNVDLSEVHLTSEQRRQLGVAPGVHQ